jgi:signal transduction histidine kinase
VDLTLDASPCWAEADRDAVRQIATNLLTNALKYAPDGQPVGLSTNREDGVAVLRVRDAGAQILGPERRRIFQRFHRGSGAAERSSGAGLGLTIARELAEAQGGTLELEGGGAGTSFALKLPAHTASGGRGTDLGRLVSGQGQRSS